MDNDEGGDGKMAKMTAAKIRKEIHDGRNPIAEHKRARFVIPTFREAAFMVQSAYKPGWKNG